MSPRSEGALGEDAAGGADRTTNEIVAPESILQRFDQWQKVGIAIAGLLTLLAQLWLALQKEWRLTAVTLILAGIALALYVVFFRNRHTADPVWNRRLRLAAVAVLIAIPLGCLAFLFAYSYLPRATAAGNTIAVSRFDGPALPAPYENCRPSAMLVHALADVSERFHRLTVFEVPYGVDPDRRWADTWAQSHGWLDAADAIVYGDYDVAKSDDKLHEADEITINPRVNAVPKVPIADKVPPLYSWEFPRRTMPIARLCGAVAGAAQSNGFVDDARRLALAIVSADLFAEQDYEGSKRALDAAKIAPPGSACDGPAGPSDCTGVLAFYLANVDLRFGNFAAAEREYRYAADHLESPAPSVSLGELEIRLGHAARGFDSFDRAVRTDPSSVAALATRSLYERDYLHAREAAVDLERALTLPVRHFYDISALSRALYQRGSPGDTACGLAMLQRAISGPEFDRRTMLETYVRYGVWLAQAKRAAAAEYAMREALEIDPYSIKGNYWLGVALRQRGLPQDATAHFRQALYAPAFTDEDFLDRANAANELRKLATDDAERDAERAAARDAYGRALAVNANAVYALWDRGLLEDELRQFDLAGRDFRNAAQLHPFDATLTSTYSSFLAKHGDAARSGRFREQTQAVLHERIPADEAAQWSSSACRYVRSERAAG